MRAALYLHLRVKEAGGGLNNGSGTVVRGDLEQAALGVGDDGHELDLDVLGLQIESEGIRDRCGLAGAHLKVVLRRRHVMHDALVGWRVGGQGFARAQGARDKCDVNRSSLIVGYLNDSPGGLTIHQTETNELGIGEAGCNLGIERRRDGRFRSGIL